MLSCVLLESRCPRHWLLDAHLLFPSNLADYELLTIFTRFRWFCFKREGFMFCRGEGTPCKVGTSKASIPVTGWSINFAS